MSGPYIDMTSCVLKMSDSGISCRRSNSIFLLLFVMTCMLLCSTSLALEDSAMNNNKSKVEIPAKIITAEADMSGVFEQRFTRRVYDQQQKQLQQQASQLQQQINDAQRVSSTIPKLTKRLQTIQRDLTRTTKQKRKIELEKELTEETKDESTLQSQLKGLRKRYGQIEKALLSLETKKKTTQTELQSLLTDVDLNWGEGA